MAEIAAGGMSTTSYRSSGRTRKRRPELAIPAGGWFQAKFGRSSEEAQKLTRIRNSILRSPFYGVGAPQRFNS
jgi:hypothetical protein